MEPFSGAAGRALLQKYFSPCTLLMLRMTCRFFRAQIPPIGKNSRERMRILATETRLLLETCKRRDFTCKEAYDIAASGNVESTYIAARTASWKIIMCGAIDYDQVGWLKVMSNSMLKSAFAYTLHRQKAVKCFDYLLCVIPFDVSLHDLCKCKSAYMFDGVSKRWRMENQNEFFPRNVILDFFYIAVQRADTEMIMYLHNTFGRVAFIYDLSDVISLDVFKYVTEVMQVMPRICSFNDKPTKRQEEIRTWLLSTQHACILK
jgi:hypothetical protein